MPAKILVADDDRTLLEALSMILKDKGYEVVAVPDGQDLKRLLDEERPDLLMLDIMMPKVDGLQLLQQVKEDERWQDLPVLMISSMAPEEATVRSLGLGAADFIAKPFRVKELTARVEAQLRQGEALRTARIEAAQRAEEAAIRAEMVDILHEVTDALAPDDIYHVLTRRVANVLNVTKCSMVLAKQEDQIGKVVVASENPMLRNLEIGLDRYPEIADHESPRPGDGRRHRPPVRPGAGAVEARGSDGHGAQRDRRAVRAAGRTVGRVLPAQRG
jgi:two-component system cell cycle response regulator